MIPEHQKWFPNLAMLTLEPRNNKAQPCGLGQVLVLIGAGEMNRTPDLLITNELLYRLSYTGFQAQNYSIEKIGLFA